MAQEFSRSWRTIEGIPSAQKKSKTGIKTPKADQDLVASRLKDAEQHYREIYGKDS
jgi:hypothetical protein